MCEHGVAYIHKENANKTSFPKTNIKNGSICQDTAVDSVVQVQDKRYVSLFGLNIKFFSLKLPTTWNLFMN